MKKPMVVFLIALLLLVTVSSLAYRTCFNQFFGDLERCAQLPAGPLQDTCADGAFQVLMTCLSIEVVKPGSQLFGAKIPSMTFARSKGKPEIATNTFTIDEAGTYYVNLFNGNESDKSTRVSAAEIKIWPDITVFSPNDFKKNAWLTVQPVFLEAGQYTLSTELRSQPGTFVVITISDRNFSLITGE